MPSSKKSTHKSSKTIIKLTDNKAPSVSFINDLYNDNYLLFHLILTILYNVLIIMYLNNLEDKSCKCIIDWRHKYIKYYCGVMIFMSLMPLINLILRYNMSSLVMNSILLLCSCINTYCLFTYVGDLDSTKCTCAVEKQKKIHYLLYFWRWILVILFIITVFMYIISI